VVSEVPREEVGHGSDRLRSHIEAPKRIEVIDDQCVAIEVQDADPGTSSERVIAACRT
jgi:hypothetical protein